CLARTSSPAARRPKSLPGPVSAAHRDDRPPSKAAPPRPSGKHFTLRRKLTASLMVVGLASLCVAGLAYAICDVVSLRGALLDRCALLAERAAVHWQELGSDPVRDASWAEDLTGDPVVENAWVLDLEGKVIASQQKEGPKAVPASDGGDFLHPIV